MAEVFQIQIRNGTAAEVDAFTGAFGELTYDTDTKQLRLHDGSTTGGFTLLRDDGSGNYGIGTTSPDGSLHISNTFPTIYLTDTDTGADSRISAGSSAGSMFIIADLNNEVAGSALTLGVDGNNLFTLDGIGQTVLSGSTTAFDTAPGISGTGLNQYYQTTNGVGYIGSYSSGGSTQLSFLTNSGGGTMSEAMRIDSSGNMGIGTTSPDGQVHIVGGSAGAVAADTTANQLVVEHNDNGGISVLVPDASNAHLFLGTASENTGTIMRWDYDADLLSLGTNKAGGEIALLTNTFDEAMRIGSSGDVGIGTTSPDGTLHVHTGSAGTVDANNVADELVLENSASAGLTILTPNNEVGYIMFGDPEDADTGRIFYNHTSNYMAFAVNGGVEAMRIDSSGNMGIGTTSPVAQSRLTVFGSVSVNGSDDDFALGGNRAFMDLATGVARLGSLTGGGAAIETAIYAASAERIRINSNGNVGIRTTAPDGSLHVHTDSAGTVTANAAADDLVVENSTDGGISVLTPAASAGYLIFGSPNGNAEGQLTYQSSTQIMSIGTFVSGGQLRFYTDTFTEAMRIGSSGDVGIGLTSAEGKLHVRDTSAGANPNAFILQNRSSTVGTTVGINFIVATADLSDNRHASINAFNEDGLTARGLSFSVGVSGASPTEALRISSTGQHSFTGSAAAFDTTPAVAGLQSYYLTGSGVGYIGTYSGGGSTNLAVLTNSGGGAMAEVARFTSAGHFLVSKTATTIGVAGVALQSDGYSWFTRDSGEVAIFNRTTDDGTLVNFYQDGTSEGSISVSGTTVSYNAFAGSHWSRFENEEMPEVLVGTLIESTGKQLTWPNEQDDKHTYGRICQTTRSKAVAGVFMAYDFDDDLGDFYCTAVGRYLMRLHKNQTPKVGDLLESDGSYARISTQQDNLKSYHVAKVMGTTKLYEAADGSFCVPVELMIGG